MLYNGLYDQCVAKTMPRPSYTQDMTLHLKEMFGEQSRSAWQIAMKNLMSTKMVEGTLVREHVLKMISFINELDMLGAEIDSET